MFITIYSLVNFFVSFIIVRVALGSMTPEVRMPAISF